MEIKETCYKGCVIRVGNEKRRMINATILGLEEWGFTEISIPIIQHQVLFAGKVGKENGNMMFNFKDAGQRDLCLAPEYTAVIQQLAKTTYKMQKDVKLFYIAECFRGEKPQAGRYRQFTQLGVEILNPTRDYTETLKTMAEVICMQFSVSEEWVTTIGVQRGLDYYKEASGFEIAAPSLGGQKQVCGGGSYEGGVGFALGIDRLMLLK